MELHKAIKEIIASKGADMICNAQIINYLLDYQAFKEKPATKLILRAIIDSGYAENIMTLMNTNDWETKFRQYQYEFIDSCGYKEELAAYVFESIAYGLGLNISSNEPEIKLHFNVDSFFDVPEFEQPQQPNSTPNQNQQKADPTDLYTIALSFYNEGKCQQAKGFMEKALAQYPQSNVPALYLKLMGDIHMKLDCYQEAIKYYNDCFVQKAAELKVTVDHLRESLKQHKVKGFENSIFCYFFCMYYSNGMSDVQWQQFVKGEARCGLMEAIQYCADYGINPIDDHFDIFFVDRQEIKYGDYVYNDGTFAHEESKTKKAVARICLCETSEYEKSQGWSHGYIIPLEPVKQSTYARLAASSKFSWSREKVDLPFPHSHYTIDDLNHWKEIDVIESEHFISIPNIELYPTFNAVINYQHKCPITNSSGWFLPSIHHLKRIYISFVMPYGFFWTSSQADKDHAILFDRNSLRRFEIEDKYAEYSVLPIAAF